MTTNNYCIHHDHPGELCWIAELSMLEQPSDGDDATLILQEDITLCHVCEKFKTVTARGFGRRSADQAIMSTIARLVGQLSIKNQNLEMTAIQLQQSLAQLNLLSNITDALARSDTLEKSLRIILTGTTSGDAFGFNRAAVFLVNENTRMLEGKSAIGPDSVEEAGRIWEKISKVPLARLLEEIIIENEFFPCMLETRIRDVRISLRQKNNPLIQILKKAAVKVIDPAKEYGNKNIWQWWPNAKGVVVVPLVCEGKPLGLMIADKVFTNSDLSDISFESLKALANACAPGLQNAILHQQLRDKIKELERVHELFKANQAYLVRHERLADIGTLATKVAHEFRIPLVTIGGYARRMLKTLGTDKFDNKMVEVIIDEVERLTRITSEILEYSRGSKLNIRHCSIESVVDDSINQLADKIKAHDVDMEKRYTDNKLIAPMDSERMKQVILNLIDNAVDAMTSGGKLSVKTSRRNEYIVLDISDNGSGIDKNGLENLFNLFYTTKEDGSGLGLPVAKKIIDDHGGYIYVESNPGQGTTFSIRLPAQNLTGSELD